MRQRVRKFIGIFGLLGLIAVYSLIVMAFAATKLPSLSGFGQLVFFIVAGLLWVLPAGLIVTWMQRPDRPPPAER